MRDEQSSSERLACFHTIADLGGHVLAYDDVAARDRPVAVAAGPDRVVARGDVERSATSAETRQVQAGELIVRSCSTTSTSRPATAFSTFGVTAMSEPTQVPSGWASTGACAGLDRLLGPCLGLRGGARRRRQRRRWGRRSASRTRTASRRSGGRRRRRRTTSRRCRRRAAVRSRTPAAGRCRGPCSRRTQ